MVLTGYRLSFVTDLVPTVLDLAGVDVDNVFDGRSLGPLLSDPAGRAYGDAEAVGLEVAGNAALFRGPYKLTRNTLPHGDASWGFYNIVEDPAEQIDLTQSYPLLYNEMLAAYNRYAREMGVIAVPGDFDVQAQIGKNALAKLLKRHFLGVVAGLILVSGALYLCLSLVRSRNGSSMTRIT